MKNTKIFDATNPDAEFFKRQQVLLTHYTNLWGAPSFRHRVQLHDGSSLESYSFSPHKADDPFHFATVGVSHDHPEASSRKPWELFLAIPADLVGSSQIDILKMLTDIAAYGIYDSPDFRPGTVLTDVPTIPSEWATKSIFVDEALCEPECASPVNFEAEQIHLYWLVFVHTAELALVNRSAEEFYRYCESTGWHPTDPRRPVLKTNRHG